MRRAPRGQPVKGPTSALGLALRFCPRPGCARSVPMSSRCASQRPGRWRVRARLSLRAAGSNAWCPATRHARALAQNLSRSAGSCDLARPVSSVSRTWSCHGLSLFGSGHCGLYWSRAGSDRRTCGSGRQAVEIGARTALPIRSESGGNVARPHMPALDFRTWPMACPGTRCGPVRGHIAADKGTAVEIAG